MTMNRTHEQKIYQAIDECFVFPFYYEPEFENNAFISVYNQCHCLRTDFLCCGSHAHKKERENFNAMSIDTRISLLGLHIHMCNMYTDEQLIERFGENMVDSMKWLRTRLANKWDEFSSQESCEPSVCKHCNTNEMCNFCNLQTK